LKPTGSEIQTGLPQRLPTKFQLEPTLRVVDIPKRRSAYDKSITVGKKNAVANYTTKEFNNHHILSVLSQNQKKNNNNKHSHHHTNKRTKKEKKRRFFY
jgi:hypothetical protein